MKDSKAIVKKEIGYMKRGGAPKSLIKHEQAEHRSMGKSTPGKSSKFKNGGRAGKRGC